jgi:hypothetical protein
VDAIDIDDIHSLELQYGHKDIKKENLQVFIDMYSLEEKKMEEVETEAEKE